MESPHKDQCKFPVHQSAAHHGVGAGRHCALLYSAASEVRLPASNLMMVQLARLSFCVLEVFFRCIVLKSLWSLLRYCFYFKGFFFFLPWGMWDINFLTRD